MFNVFRWQTEKCSKLYLVVGYHALRKRRFKLRAHYTNVYLVLIYLMVLLLFEVGNCNRPPQFSGAAQSEIILHLKESPATKIGSLIYKVSGFDPDNDTLTFDLRPTYDSKVIRIENIDDNTANIYLAQELDREIQDSYTVVITLTDEPFSSKNYVTQSLLIIVEDINDNIPIFLPYPNPIELPENFEPGVIATLEATDKDAGAFGQVVYFLQEIDNGSDMFSISTYQSKGILRLTRQLDYETKSLYQLRILAIDRANIGPVNTGTAALLVKVVDIEDQPPEFIEMQAISRIPENVAIGTEVLRIRAIDGDHGINNPIRYAIDPNPFFAIGLDTGIIHTTNELDREDTSNGRNGAYILGVTATEVSGIMNNSAMKKSIKTEVTIIVTDVNDNIPTFGAQTYNCEVNENSQTNTLLNFLGDDSQNFVFDHDFGKNGTFRLYLDPPDDIFEIVPDLAVNELNFMIRVKNSTPIDFELVKEMQYQLIAQELTDTDRWSSSHLQINVLDQNDNFPEFSQSIYNCTIPENSEIGTIITKIEATDVDFGDYGTWGIRYNNLRGAIANLLQLNAISGIITVKQLGGSEFDREMISRHYLTVEAVDNVGRGNRNSAQIIIHIEDENDNAPKFLLRHYEAKLLENQGSFERVLLLEARDDDLEGTENSQITYEIVEGIYKSNFSINAENGNLIPLHSFDYENLMKDHLKRTDNNGIHEVELLVRARDSGIPMLSTVVPVIIYIYDINDNPPIFERSYYQKTIPENTRSGSSILQVIAIDRDGSSPNNLIIYRIQNGASDKFIIGPQSGVVSVAPGAVLDPDLIEPKQMEFILTVIAIDGGLGSSQLTSTASVNITIKDINNKLPVFKEMPTIKLKENTPVGTFVFKLEALDSDEQPIIRYKINKAGCIGRNEIGSVVKPQEYDYIGAFDLDPIDGTLRMSKLLDREKIESIKLSVLAEDIAAETGKQEVEAFLHVQVDDENDNEPKFKHPFYLKTIPENSMNGALIANVVAYDIDKNQTVEYFLQAPSIIADLINLDPFTGEVTVSNKIDYEKHQWLNFSIQATDSGLPPRSAIVDVFISVLDENDNNPYFIGEPKNFTVRENSVIGTYVGTIHASDSDSGDFGKITFVMDRLSSQNKFIIDDDKGILTVAGLLDRETKNTYMLVIEIWDNYQFGFTIGESRNAFTQIFITVLDENDNSPVVFAPTNCVYISEYHNLREKILTIHATDADDPNTPNGRIAFSISTGNKDDLFELRSVEKGKANVFARHSLQNRFQNYSLTIVTNDFGVPSNIVNKVIHICVTDVNDHAPIFLSPAPNTTIRVPENTTVGTMITQLYAIDEDVGMNSLVRYRIRTDSVGSFKLFEVDSDTGQLYLKKPLDRKVKKFHEIRVEAYDQGIPTSLTTDLDFIIYVSTTSAFEPNFVTNAIHINFTEHRIPGIDRITLPETLDKEDYDIFDDQIRKICYYILKGNELGYFAIDPENHILTTVKELDREMIANYTLYVKCTENCSVNFQEGITQQDRDQNLMEMPNEEMLNANTILQLHIRVMDINDNPPHFVTNIFTGGITTNASFGTKFMRIEAIDPDEDANAKVKYYQVGEIRQTLSEGLDNIRQIPFLIDSDTGEIQLNFDPQNGMKGYFDFKVLANDSLNNSDTAHVFIYLLREDQKIRFVFRLQPTELRRKIEMFRGTLSNLTNAIVNIDEIKLHINRDGSVDKTKTDLLLHLVKLEDNSIYEVAEVFNMIDAHIESLDDIFKELNVLDTQPAVSELLISSEPKAGMLLMSLIFINIFLIFLVIVVMVLYASQRKDYQRRLRAAKVKILRNSSLSLPNNTPTSLVPNTNKHSIQANPIWLKGKQNEWTKNEECISAQVSLDDNDFALGMFDLQQSLNDTWTSKLFNYPTNDLNLYFSKLTRNANELETTEL